MTNQVKNILIINQYSGNKGDRAVLFALCVMIKKHNPKIKITVSTSSIELWKDYTYYSDNDIRFVPWGWDYTRIKGSFLNRKYFSFLNKLKKYTYTILRENFLFSRFPINRIIYNPNYYEAVKKTDLVISTGGHHYTTILSSDMVSPLSFDLALPISLKKKIVLFSQTVGPFQFRKKRNEDFIFHLLSECSSILIREKDSIESLQFIDKKKINLIPETVISLNNLFEDYTQPSERRKRVGISIYCAQKRAKEEHENYVQLMVEICNYVNSQGLEVCFFPMEIKGTPPDDRKMIKEILGQVNSPQYCTYMDEDLTTDAHIKEVASCSYFIGHKTHSVVFALTTGTPLIAIAYHPKTIEFMKQYGLEEFAIDDKNISIEQLIPLLDTLNLNKDKIGDSMFKQSREKAQQLNIEIEKTLLL